MSTPITAAMVKELRERTGAGIADCKKALEATGGDMDKAAEKLRIDSGAKADKKASRTAAEGVIGVARNGEAIALVELNSETDFVAKGEDFRALATAAAQAALAHRPDSVEALVNLTVDGQTLDARRRALVAKIGENLTIRRFEIVTRRGGELVTYMHPGDKIAVVVAMAKGEEQLGKDIAMHIAAMSPRYVDSTAVPAEWLAGEKKVIEAQVAKEQAEEAADGKKPKAPEIVAKMVEGKLRKAVSEITLVGQQFVRNEAYGLKADDTTDKVLKARDTQIAHFVRFAVGEGIERAKTDFAAEVAASMKT